MMPKFLSTNLTFRPSFLARTLLFTLALLLLLLQSCAGPSTIRKNGLSYLKVGDPMPAQSQQKLEGRPLNTSIVTEEGYSWRVCTLDYPKGAVLVESDFSEQKVVSRIRVETPEFKTRNGLRVGQSLNDLLKKTDRWIAKPFPRYQLIELISMKYPRQVFLLQVEGFDYANADATVPTADLPGDAKVVGIVVL